MTHNTPSSDDEPVIPALFATIHHHSDERPDGYTAEHIEELNRLANQRRRKRLPQRRTLYIAGGAFVLVGALLAGAVWMSPMWMPGRIVKAAEIGDRSKLEKLVDFPAIRMALKIDAKDMMKATYRSEIAASGDPFAMMFSGIGDSIVEATADTMVDQLITPLALEKAASGRDVQFSLFGEARNAFPEFRYARGTAPTFTIKGRYLTVSRYEFTLRSIDSDRRLDVQMQRTGPFSWRIDRVQIDPSFFAGLQNSDAGHIPSATPDQSAQQQSAAVTADDNPPAFTDGQTYSSYRRTLLSAGFTAVPQDHSEPNYFCGTEFLEEGEPDLCTAYPEVEDCGGTGMRPCTFVFRRTSDGRRLDVLTVGELFSQISVQGTEWRN